MKESRTGGASNAKTSSTAAPEAPGRERRMTARRKQEAVLRVLRVGPLETVAREFGVGDADLNGWHDRFLESGDNNDLLEGGAANNVLRGTAGLTAC